MIKLKSHERSKRRRGLEASSAASYLFNAALHAFLNCGLWSSFFSRFFSLVMLCHIEIDTKEAHSFLTIPLSNDWKALMMKERRCVRIVADSVKSRVMDRILRNRLENSAGCSAKVSGAVSVLFKP